MGLHQSFTSRLGKIFTFLFVACVLFSILCVVTVISESNASLAISVSIVEGDTFRPGQSFHIITEIRNSKSSGRVDVKVTYEVTDVNDNSILVESVTVAIETLSSFSEEIKIPETLTEGIYVLRASVVSLDGINCAETSVSFNVVRVVTESEQRIIEFIMGGALIVTIVVLVFEHRRISKLKVSGSDLKRFVIEKKK